MGGWLSALWWGGDPDVADALSGLSRRDVHAVSSSWARVYQHAESNGTELLKRYFRAYPEAKQFFRMIRDLPEEEFVNNFQFKAHVINLMAAINMAVQSLHQPKVVVVMMEKLGESHRRRKIQTSHFHDLTKVFVQLLKDALSLDEAALGSWSRTINFFYKHIFRELNAVEKR